MSRSTNVCGKHLLSRFFLRALVLLFAIRLLLPAGIMFGNAASDGDFGLVLCTGHGVAVAQLSIAQDGNSAVNGEHFFDRVVRAAALADVSDSSPLPARSDHRQSANPSDICPFNAVLTLAIAALAVLCVFRLCASQPEKPLAPRTHISHPQPFASAHGARAPPPDVQAL